MSKRKDEEQAAPADREFAGRARARFEESVERLDAATLSTLNQRRQAAFAAAAKQARPGMWLAWMPAGGLAAAAVIAVVMLNQQGAGVIPEPGDAAATDFEILLGDDSLEMIEDLEFYSWLEAADMDDVGNVG